MSWANKALERYKIDKAIKEALSSPEYKKMERENKVQTLIEAYARFCLIACDYLQIKHNYKKNGMIHFLTYAAEVMKDMPEGNENYFHEINQVMIDECGIDVMGFLGMDFEEETEKR